MWRQVDLGVQSNKINENIIINVLFLGKKQFKINNTSNTD